MKKKIWPILYSSYVLISLACIMHITSDNHELEAKLAKQKERAGELSEMLIEHEVKAEESKEEIKAYQAYLTQIQDELKALNLRLDENGLSKEKINP